MRNTRIGALLASSALASATILGGAAVASAENTAEPQVVDDATIVMKVGGSDVEGAAGRYTIKATAYDNCTVDFELTNDWPEGYIPSFRADYRVGDEPAVMPGSGREGETYRPVLGSHDGIETAIKGRDNPYDFDTGTVTIDLTESRIVPKYDDVSQVTTLPGVQANEDGKHVITFGVYQGPNTAASNEYSFGTTVTVEGCPTTEEEETPGDGELPGDDETPVGGLIGSIIGSVDVFGSLGSIS